jgi:uncharacterized membrane protein
MQEEKTVAPTQPQGPRRTLFQHIPHPHQPRNVNLVHKQEKEAAGLNTRIAVGLTQSVGTMWTAYTFAILAIIGLLAILGLLSPIVALLVAWISQTFIQLVLLPIIMVGQNVLGRKAELQADEQFNTTIKTYHDIEEIMQHLSAQDDQILKQSHMIIHLLRTNGISQDQLQVIEQTGELTTSNSNQQ